MSTTSQRSPGTDMLHFIGSMKREVPKIGGTVGGFIALVVCLIVVILASSIAVFYLLRNHEPEDVERNNRRQRSRYPLKVVSPSSAYSYTPSSAAPKPRTLLGRLGGLFRSSAEAKDPNSDVGRVRPGRGGQGWMQTGSMDEWGSDSGDEGLRTQDRDRKIGHPPAIDSPFRPPGFHPYPTSPSNSGDYLAMSEMPYRAAGKPSSQPILPSIHSRLSSPTSSISPSPIPLRTTSPEPLPGHEQSDVFPERGNRTFSSSSVRTFEGGTKFIESL